LALQYRKDQRTASHRDRLNPEGSCQMSASGADSGFAEPLTLSFLTSAGDSGFAS
jgi:hypothetical protein